MHDREPNSGQRTGKEGSVLKGGEWSLNYGSERTTLRELERVRTPPAGCRARSLGYSLEELCWPVIDHQALGMLERYVFGLLLSVDTRHLLACQRQACQSQSATDSALLVPGTGGACLYRVHGPSDIPPHEDEKEKNAYTSVPPCMRKG